MLPTTVHHHVCVFSLSLSMFLLSVMRLSSPSLSHSVSLPLFLTRVFSGRQTLFPLLFICDPPPPRSTKLLFECLLPPALREERCLGYGHAHKTTKQQCETLANTHKHTHKPECVIRTRSLNMESLHHDAHCSLPDLPSIKLECFGVACSPEHLRGGEVSKKLGPKKKTASKSHASKKPAEKSGLRKPVRKTVCVISWSSVS